MNKMEDQIEDIPDEDQETSSIEKPLTVIQNEEDDKRKLIVVLEKAYELLHFCAVSKLLTAISKPQKSKEN